MTPRESFDLVGLSFALIVFAWLAYHVLYLLAVAAGIPPY